MKEKASLNRILLLIIILICAIVVSIYFVLKQEQRQQGLDTAQYVFPVIAILAIIASILTLALVSIVFASFQEAPSQHALGMPQGSIRALVALSLLTSFIITAVFMFSSLNEQPFFRQHNVTPEQLSTLNIREYKVIDTVRVLSYPLEINTDPLTGKTDTLRTDVYSVDIVSPTTEASSDFAKQLLTVLGTLVIAVCSFYFGSRSTEQGSVMASEIINGSVIAAEQARSPSSPKPVPEQVIAEAIKQNRANWLTVYGVSDVVVGKKKSGDTVSFINCIQFVVPNKDSIAEGAKIIPSTIKYTAANGEVYDIPTDVVSSYIPEGQL